MLEMSDRVDRSLSLYSMVGAVDVEYGLLVVLGGDGEDEQHELKGTREEEVKAFEDWASDTDDAGCTQQAQEHAEELRQPQRQADLSEKLQEGKAVAALGCRIVL